MIWTIGGKKVAYFQILEALLALQADSKLKNPSETCEIELLKFLHCEPKPIRLTPFFFFYKTLVVDILE